MFRLFYVIAAALCFAATSSAQTVEHTFRFNAGTMAPGAYYGQQQQFPAFDPGTTCGGTVPVGNLPARFFAPQYQAGYAPIGVLPAGRFIDRQRVRGIGPVLLPNRFVGAHVGRARFFGAF